VSLPAPPAALCELAPHLPPGAEAWLVGGAVRDLLLGRPLKDVDLAVPRGALALARRLASRLGGAFVPLDPERGVARVVWRRDDRQHEVDLADFRAPTLEADLLARDVTINALAISVHEPRQLVDPAGGRDDLAARRIRLLAPSVLVDDPLRGLRAVRLAAQLGFQLDGTSAAWIAARAGDLATVSAERVRDELWKALLAPAPATTLRRLDALGLLAVVVPEAPATHGVEQSAPHRHDVWEHTLAVVERTAALVTVVDGLAAATTGTPAPGPTATGGEDTSREKGEAAPADLAPALAPFAAALAQRLAAPLAADRTLRGHLLLAALFHDLGKPATHSVGADGRIHFYGHEVVGAELTAERLLALKLAQSEVQWVARMVRHHMRPLQLRGSNPLSPRALHRFHRATAEIAPEVCLLSLADNLAKGGVRTHQEWPTFLPRVVELLDAYFFRHAELVAPPRLIDGRDLLAAAGTPPGPWVGETLAALAEAQATGEVASREAALSFALRWLADHHEGSAGEAPAAERQ
jgi:poly(A) polymerase/tRNA nucleotidyltransferase (CCA-adding enzyme)